MVWTKHQNSLFESVAGKPLRLAGDGRADSPGHSAKYGTYSLIDIDRNKVLHVETVQSNETGGSSQMELEGLKRSLQIFEANGLIIDLMVTDRHTQIKAFAAKEGNFEHNYDCWHIGKCYIKELMESTVEICRRAGSLKEASLQANVIMPPTLSSEFEHEDKDSLIAKRRARFNRKCMWT
ncbi:hypothetical protein HPB52_019866 [Rhipicephalus sanguineus]|uniref:Uncharacterized protein n=1 Tax=Rhipicephalus sanguineus TaxID=34632 RepID=A0A9D4SRX6_RHISA|nr:hypothetical protein HPB52_019866 [Rhipicephalus sanguineus]